MADCKECGAKSRPNTHLYRCGVCNETFCDDHCCNLSYIKHLRGKDLPEIDKLVAREGAISKSYLCKWCFIEHGPDDQTFISNIFDKKCAIDGCTSSLGLGSLKKKYSCVSCGKLVCSQHHLTMDQFSGADKWLAEFGQSYPLAECVCSQCLMTKSSNKSGIERHPNCPLLRLVAGDASGERKAIVVHGILSGSQNLSQFSQQLMSTGLFDAVWLFDDIAYQGRVNDATRLSLSDIPTALSLNRLAIKLGSKIAAKAISVLDLPPYIVEGAGRSLASVIMALDWNNVVLFGHSLGGLVVRCATESYNLGGRVSHVITLGSPFRIWLMANSTSVHWPDRLNKDVQYLAVLGKNDFVAPTRHLADLTKNDSAYDNLLKVIFPGADHTQIHTEFSAHYGFRFLEEYLSHNLFERKDNFYLRSESSDESNTGKPDADRKLSGRNSVLHGAPTAGDHTFLRTGEWIEMKE